MVASNIPPDESFGQKCMRVLAEKRKETLTAKLTPEECAAIIDKLFTEAKRRKKKLPGEPKTPRPRNPLVDGLMAACNEDPLNATRPALRAAGTAIAEIKAVSPDVTVEEISRRARLYRQKHPLWTLTPTALGKWWGESCPPKSVNQKKDPYTAPDNWQALATRVWGDVNLPDNWTDISLCLRQDLLKHA